MPIYSNSVHRVTDCILVFVCSILFASAAFAAEGAPALAVSRFDIAYGLPHPLLPPAEELIQTEMPLGINDGIYVPVDAAGTSATSVVLGSLPAGARFSSGAIVAVMERIVSELNRRDLQMVFVRPDPRQVNLTDLTDLRSPDDRSLRLIVWVG